LLARAHQGDSLGIGQAFERLGALAAGRGLMGPDTVSLGVYHDDPDVTPADRAAHDLRQTTWPRPAPRTSLRTSASRRGRPRQGPDCAAPYFGCGTMRM
jgi:DNA gyrase inhibitor GyrI